MGIRIYPGKLQRGDAFWTIMDISMLVLVSIHIGIMSIEWILSAKLVRESFQAASPAGFNWYISTIHENFVLIDLVFVIIYISELLLRWVVAIIQKTYHRWFFYPFIHWYDVLGSIPLGSFRFLRVLRIFSVISRLQNKGIIDVRDTYIVRSINKYGNILMEELSDRVVIKVLEGVQVEAKRGNPLIDEIINKVILPKREILVTWLSHRIQKVVSHGYERHQKNIRFYLEDLVQHAVDRNREMKKIELIPGVGTMITTQVERAITDITYSVLTGLIEDLASPHNREMIDELAEMGFEAILDNQDSSMDIMIVEAIVKSLELMKKQVRIKNWKVKYGSDEEVELLSLLD